MKKKKQGQYNTHIFETKEEIKKIQFTIQILLVFITFLI